MAKTLKTKGFTIESRNRYGKVVFKVYKRSILPTKDLEFEQLLKVLENATTKNLKQSNVVTHLLKNSKGIIQSMKVSGEPQEHHSHQMN